MDMPGRSEEMELENRKNDNLYFCEMHELK